MLLSGLDSALIITALVTVLYQLFFFFIAAYAKFDKVTDLAGGSNFIIIAFLTFSLYSLPNANVRQYINTIIVLIWGVRITTFLLYRVILFKKDDRFDGTREDPCKFLGFWVFQMLWAWVVSLPLIYLNSSYKGIRPRLNVVDWFGFFVAVIGIFIESWADQTKLKFRSNPENLGRWCNIGIWQYSRHPNYFGELLMWWGVFISCTQSFYNENDFGFFTILGPLFVTFLLLGLSGMPILEQRANSKFGKSLSYREYRKETSILIPLPKFVYRSLPPSVKAFFCFEWALYTNGCDFEHSNFESSPLQQGLNAEEP